MSLPSWYLRVFCLLLIAATFGCRQPERIQTYTVPKETPEREVAVATGTQPDRMLAAILPEGERAWFFKVVGPTAEIDRHSDQISEFLTGIRLAGDQPLPEWKLPAGWTQQPGNAMRAATLVIPGEKPLELTVTTLGWRGTPEDMLNNVNRWRGQMQLPPVGPEQLADTTRELKAGAATITLVDLRGRFQSGMNAPFAGGAPFSGEGASATGNPAVPPNTNTPNELPAGHPPIASGEPANSASPPLQTDQAPTDSAASNLPKFTAPASWQPASGGGFSRAAFTITEGPRKARVTISEFPTDAGPMITDPLANVNRWRGEIGLPAVDKETVENVTKPILIDGQAATYMPAIPDASESAESQSKLATLAAMVPVGPRVWFFKITGDRDLVAAEQERFRTFLDSVRFTAGRGATDGN